MSADGHHPPAALLTVDEMARADRLAVAHGVSGTTLMARAGEAVARAILARWRPRPVLVMCGPGNNGGDGFVVARRLGDLGWPVTVALLGDSAALRGDAAAHADRWRGGVAALSPGLVERHGLIVDALFGAGLGRPLDGTARDTVEAVAGSGLPVVAVDLPSGVHGDDGLVHGAAAPASVTVTFFRPKPGHLLEPGRSLCGTLIVADIGIPESALEAIAPRQGINRPAAWRRAWPAARAAGHKYDHGHVLALSGAMSGASRLAAAAARSAGAGLVTVAADPSAVATIAASSPGLIVLPCDGGAARRALLADARRNALLVGPGAGSGDATRAAVRDVLATGRAAVLDADALTAFADAPESLFDTISGTVVMTPHGGEFRRLFGAADGGKLAATRAAAARSGAVVVHKGRDTVIAGPDGRALINDNASPNLATAGTGDVLAGIVAALLARGMPAFEAAAAAVWLHGAAAGPARPGFVAEALVEALPAAIARTIRSGAAPGFPQ